MCCRTRVADPQNKDHVGYLAGLSAIIHALPLAAAVVESTGAVVQANDAATRLFGAHLSSSGLVVFRDLAACAGKAGEPVTNWLKTPLNHRAEVTVAPIAPDLFLVTSAVEAVPLDTNPARLSESTPTLYSPQDTTRTPTRALREEAARFKRLSETDPLTGALNVRAFAARVKQALMDRPRRRGALIFLDLNGFKEINDGFGHAAGDLVLVHVAQKLTFPPQTWVATGRLGGDEFALWMPGVEPSALPNVIAGIHARLSVPADVPLGAGRVCQVTVSASVGAACCPFESRNYESLRHVADTRMYEQKAIDRAKRAETGLPK